MTRYPLTWPTGWRRILYIARRSGRFNNKEWHHNDVQCWRQMAR